MVALRPHFQQLRALQHLGLSDRQISPEQHAELGSWLVALVSGDEHKCGV
jgi:hypothetical protein